MEQLKMATTFHLFFAYLLPNKPFEIFTLVPTNYLAIKCNFLFSSRFVTINFEIALHKSVINVWPTMKIVGCRFHQTQSWYHQVQNLKLNPKIIHQEKKHG